MILCLYRACFYNLLYTLQCTIEKQHFMIHCLYKICFYNLLYVCITMFLGETSLMIFCLCRTCFYTINIHCCIIHRQIDSQLVVLSHHNNNIYLVFVVFMLNIHIYTVQGLFIIQSHAIKTSCFLFIHFQNTVVSVICLLIYSCITYFLCYSFI